MNVRYLWRLWCVHQSTGLEKICLDMTDIINLVRAGRQNLESCMCLQIDSSCMMGFLLMSLPLQSLSLCLEYESPKQNSREIQGLKL